MNKIDDQTLIYADMAENALHQSQAEVVRRELIEVAVFLFLIVPSMALSLFAVRQGDVTFMLAAVATILRDLALVSLVLFFLWRNGEPVIRIGWTFRNAWKDTALGVVLFFPLFFGAAMLEKVFLKIGLTAPSIPLPSFLDVQGRAETLLAVILVVVVALAEETIFRGYLLLRFMNLTRSPTAGVLLSSLVFAVGHGYEGTAGLATVGVMGAAFALVYLWRGSLVAPVVMHFLQDILTIVLLPYLVGK